MTSKSPLALLMRVVEMVLSMISTCFHITISVLSFKVIPVSWHIRIFYAYFLRYKFVKRPVSPPKRDSLTVFQPTVFSSQVALGEMDYFGHKSNSTYFVDMDFARGHHIYGLFRDCIRNYESRNTTREAAPVGRFNIALGGITCLFKRSIPLFRRYEIWTRVCYWDDKWIYLISHFVQEGVVRPDSFSDMAKKQPTAKSHDPDDEGCSENHQPVIYAVLVSKVVFKEGRRTIPPITFLQAGNLLPQTTDGNGEREDRDDREVKVPRGESNTCLLWDAINREKSRGKIMTESILGLDNGIRLFDKDVKVAFHTY